MNYKSPIVESKPSDVMGYSDLHVDIKFGCISKLFSDEN